MATEDDKKIWSVGDLIELAEGYGKSGINAVSEMETVGVSKDTLHEFAAYCGAMLMELRDYDMATTFVTVSSAMFHLGYKFHEELNKENVCV